MKASSFESVSPSSLFCSQRPTAVLSVDTMIHETRQDINLTWSTVIFFFFFVNIWGWRKDKQLFVNSMKVQLSPCSLCDFLLSCLKFDQTSVFYSLMMWSPWENAGTLSGFQHSRDGLKEIVFPPAPLNRRQRFPFIVDFMIQYSNDGLKKRSALPDYDWIFIQWCSV